MSKKVILMKIALQYVQSCVIWQKAKVSVRLQMVDFGSGQGLSNFETDGVAVTAIADIASYVEDFKRAKTPLWTKRCRLWMDTITVCRL